MPEGIIFQIVVIVNYALSRHVLGLLKASAFYFCCKLKLYICVKCLDSILSEAIVGHIIMLGAGWVVKNIQFTKFYT